MAPSFTVHAVATSASFTPFVLAFQPSRLLPSKIGVIAAILSIVAFDKGSAGFGGGVSATGAAGAAGGVAASCAKRLVERVSARTNNGLILIGDLGVHFGLCSESVSLRIEQSNSS